MSGALDLPIAFRVGTRTVASLRRQLVRVAVSLEDALDGSLPSLPALPAGADGYSLLSVPMAAVAGLDTRALIVAERQRYRRWYADLTLGWGAYHAALSGNLRSTLKRKGKKIAAEDGGTLDVRRYRTPEELAAFHALARPLAAGTYQEKLLGMGLPGNAAWVEAMLRAAAADRARGWLLCIGGRAVAYLYCPVERGTVVYEFVGHDERFDALSPGTVLMAEALKDLMDEGRHARFDFTEGEGQHKRQFATGHVEACDLFLLRPTITNRAAMAALTGFDRAVAWGKAIHRRSTRT
ncbi:GNAT family N-acetyltransferase [Sphingomonas spermidinifaciens]|uniref:GNAT family N-acetyltransferase n=1 Tax=Sphingomonas spermidinifaciens TaxID=1141889 RepID=A0A2A4B4I8_9SPHN|nr:GNAT family N-acetyltransferase [Sphingomonas spermidinifaciens]PCD02584.1 GNAT family N-acetyltransferase [Sphingomonas spermidinifaciens]